MRNSIFDIEIRMDINKEFKKIYSYLHYGDKTTVTQSGHMYTFLKAVDEYAFKHWPYRGTALNCIEYLDSIGLPNYYFDGRRNINEVEFLYYLEFIYNIYMYSHEMIQIKDENVLAIFNNIYIIVEKMNYKFIQKNDKYILVKRDADLDSIIELVDNDIALLLLEYNDFRIIDNLIRKKEILKSIDLYIEKNQSQFSKLDKDTYSSIGYIMNKFGINHKIDDKYENLSENDLLGWYDKCYKLCIHLIRKKEINEINEERKKLETKE